MRDYEITPSSPVIGHYRSPDDGIEVDVVLVSATDDESGVTCYRWEESCEGDSSYTGREFRTAARAILAGQRRAVRLGGVACEYTPDDDDDGE